jgi:hypothetical protein
MLFRRPIKVKNRSDEAVFYCVGLVFWLSVGFLGRLIFLWNNRLREAVVTDVFLFLSTFFIQVLGLSYIPPKALSITIMLNFSQSCA